MFFETRGLKSETLKKGFYFIKALKKSLLKNKEKLKTGDILVISSKILALSQRRIVEIVSIRPSKQALHLKKTRYGGEKEDPRILELALREADAILPGTMVLTFKNGILIANAGIDRSNAPDGYAILWPKQPWKEAQKIWKNVRQFFRIKKLGIIISDSHCQPLRWGVSGLALAWAGFAGIEDARGQLDIYKKPLQVTRKAVADNLASSALVAMGEAGEKIPFVIIRNAPVQFTTNMPKPRDVAITPREDIFCGIYNKKFLKLIK